MVSAILTAGLLYTGMKKVAGEPISWILMVFRGWSFAGQIVLATIFQAILVTIGFLLLVFPGVYLAVGYSLTLPLIMARKMSAWEAMEASRKAIHKVWWQVSGLFGLMGLISFISFHSPRSWSYLDRSDVCNSSQCTLSSIVRYRVKYCFPAGGKMGVVTAPLFWLIMGVMLFFLELAVPGFILFFLRSRGAAHIVGRVPSSV